MATAYGILTELISSFRENIPGVDFGEALSVQNAVGPHRRAWVTGTVAKESTQGGDWSARLAFQAYLPRGTGDVEALLGAMAECAKGQPLLTGMERGGAAADKGTGLVAVGCVFTFANPGGSGSSGGKKTTYPAEVGGKACTVTGWKVTEGSPAGGITAIGESAPFYYRNRGEFSIELQGLSLSGPEKLADFTIRLGEQDITYTGCKWKSLSAGGNCTACAAGRTEGV